MQRVVIILTYLFSFAGISSAQLQTNVVTDSAWFENYFINLTTRRELNDPSTYDSLEIVKTIAEKKNYLPALSRYYIEKAGGFLSKKKTDSAISSFKTAIALAEKGKVVKEGGSAYLGLANLYQFNGNTLDAAENYLQAVKLLKNKGRIRTLIGLYHNLYSILNRLQQKNSTLQNMLSAVATSKSNETDLVAIINTRNSEDQGFYFADQSLVKEVGADIIYVIFGNAKFVVRDFRTMASYGASRDVQRIPAGTLSLIPDFPKNGSILMEFSFDTTSDPKVYLVKDSLLYHIYSPDVLETFGGWDAVYYVPLGSLSRFPKADLPVTMENRNTIFNLNQEFDILTDSIASALQKNTVLSNQLSQEIAATNNALQKRKLLLWVSAIGFSALLVIVFLLVRNFHQKQKLHQQSLKALTAEQELQRKMEIEKERTRIATDMHDDLGAGLSRIKFLSETIGIKKQKMEPIEEDIISIRQYSHEMIDKMGEIVWALNEKNDSLMDLLGYTRAYAVEYLSQHGIKCGVTMPDSFPSLFVSGEFRRNIYLCVKEVLHNTVKHARASQVGLDISIDKNLELVITDNGKGFDPNNTRAYSNGLANIKKRMTDIGGNLDMKTNNGTEVKLSVPLPL